jgi:hypothetical protein
VTIVVVVSFMIAVPFSLGAPSWAASHPCYEHLCPDPTLWAVFWITLGWVFLFILSLVLMIPAMINTGR